MWEGARVIWENTPSMSDRDLLARLQEVYGDKAPKTHSAITRRRNKEKWVKKSSTRAKSSTTSRHQKKFPSTKKSDDDPETLDNTDKNNKETQSTKQAPAGTTLTVWQETEEKILKEVERLTLDAEQKKAIILKHRKRLRQLGELQDSTIDTVNTLYGLDPKHNGDEIVQTITIAEVLSKTLKQLTDSQKTIAEQELPLCGITPEDFSQSEQEKRMQSLEALSYIDEEQRVMRQAKQLEMRERLKEFEAMQLEGIDEFEPNFDDDDGEIDDE